jgi:hypothetical protein
MIELRITWDETTGDVNVNGPLTNKGVCYLMLECARDAIKDHVDTHQKVPEISNGIGIVKPRIPKRR